MTPKTAKERILERLEGNFWLACHELKILGVSENSAATRLSEMAKMGLVEGRFRKDEAYKEWRAKPVYTHDEKGQYSFL